jgi:hypothetical protein
MHIKDTEALGAAAVCAAAWLITGDALAPVALFVMLAAYKLVATHDRLYVLILAMTFHWMQTSLGVFYHGATGRPLQAIEFSDYRPMVLIGLGCVFALALGIGIGLRLVKRRPHLVDRPRPEYAFRLWVLVALYLFSIVSEEGLLSLTTSYPSLRQVIITVDSFRLGAVFLLLRRFVQSSQWGWFSAVAALEVAMGMSGYFAGFREPVVLALLATLEVFDRHNRRHWAVLGLGSALIVLLALIWMGVRVEVRREFAGMDAIGSATTTRMQRVSTLGADFLKRDSTSIINTGDNLVDRLWAIYYPALAVQHVPEELPHTDGEILWRAIQHVLTPRVFFPNKGELVSDSDMVRKYSGVMVAGREENTSIAFGYAAESYIDFGVPLMFLPVFVFGLLMGLAYTYCRELIVHRDLFVAFVTVTFWLSLYLFERSWATTLGVAVGFFVYLGIPVLLLDRFLLMRAEHERQTRFEAAPVAPQQARR